MSIAEITEFTVDLSEVPDPLPLPVRTYPATVFEAVLYTSKSGKPTIKVAYFIAPDAYPIEFDSDNAPEGTKLNSYFGVNCGNPPAQPTKVGLARYRQVFEHHGVPMRSVTLRPRDDLAGAWGLAEDVINTLVGSRVNVAVVHETFEGRDIAKIGSISVD